MMKYWLATLLLIVGLFGCSGSVGTLPSVPQVDVLQNKAMDLDVDNHPVLLEDIRQFKDAGVTGIFQISVLGVKGKENILKIEPKHQFSLLDKWFAAFPTIVKAQEKHGTAFILWTGKADDPDLLCRHLIAATLLSGGKCSVEIAAGGVCFRFDESAPLAEHEAIMVALYFDEPQATSETLKQPVWEITIKREHLDEFTGKTILRETAYELKRGDRDQLWIKILPNALELSSGERLSDIQTKEEPGYIAEHFKSLVIKRIDPTTQSKKE